MTKKKKLLIALLSATCLTAGACGIAACKDKDDENPPKNYAYTVVAKDNNNNPVKDVWFQIGYVDQSTWMFVPVTTTVNDSEVNLVAKTGEDGKAGFDFEPEEGITYQVRLADPGDIEAARQYPYGYRIVSASVEYPENATTVDYTFTYVPNGFYENERTTLDYKRVYDETTNAPKEIKGENKLTLEKDRYTYFNLLTYQEIGGATEEEVETNQANNTAAAAGVYEVSFSTTSSAHVTMYNFVASDAYCATDADGKPTAKIDTVTSSESKITLTLTIDGYKSRAPQYFAIYADADCEVTINVTRTGDATEPVSVPKTDAAFTAPSTNFANSADGKLMLMPVDGSLSVVMGGDGYYHVGSESGPLLLVNLTKTLSRVGDSSIAELPLHSTRGSETFVVNKYENGVVVEKLDYTKLVSAYSKKVNSDGVYPVNDDLENFLKAFNSWYTAVPGSEYNWLIPCQYYAPEDGFEAKGAGTEADPFVLLEGKTKLSNTGSAWVSFTATATGIYSFSPASGMFTAPTDVVTTDDDGLLLIALNAGDTVKIQLAAASANTSVDIASEAKAVLEATTKEVNEDGVTSIEPGPGTSAADAISVSQTGLFAFVIDEDLSEDGLYIKIPALLDGTYTISTFGTGAAASFNGAPASTIKVTAGEDYGILLTADAPGVYMLYVSFVSDSGENDPYALKVGENSVTIKGEDSYTGVDYTFTSAEGGTYTLTVDNDIALVFIGFDSVIDATIDQTSYVFQLAPGGSITFNCAMNDDKDTTYNVIITEGGDLEEKVLLKLDEPVDVTIPAGFNGYESPITLTAGTTYTLVILVGRGDYQSTFTVYVSDGNSRPAQYTVNANNDFTIDIPVSANGEYTIAIMSDSDFDVESTITISAKTE